jgi:hypothetical protein
MALPEHYFRKRVVFEQRQIFGYRQRVRLENPETADVHGTYGIIPDGIDDNAVKLPAPEGAERVAAGERIIRGAVGYGAARPCVGINKQKKRR